MESKRPHPSVIRLFPGWANSPLWIPGGPVDLEESLLAPELVEDLLAWEARYYDASPQDSSGGSSGSNPGPQERQYLTDGKHLADRLAAELGHSFAVSFESGCEEHYVARSGGSATNPAATRFFAREFAEAVAEEERLRAAGELHTRAPLSGETFGSDPCPSPAGVTNPEKSSGSGTFPAIRDRP